jgi:YD repeat-containing protein
MAYCECGSPATVVEAAGTTIARTASYEYDFQGKRWKTTTPEGSMSTNHYDLLGRLVLVQDPFGWSTNRYDNLGRLVQTLNAAGPQMSVPSWNSAESAGLKTGKTQGSGGVFFRQRRQPFFLLPSGQHTFSAVLAVSSQAPRRGESGDSRKQPACLKGAGFQTGSRRRCPRRH